MYIYGPTVVEQLLRGQIGPSRPDLTELGPNLAPRTKQLFDNSWACRPKHGGQHQNTVLRSRYLFEPPEFRKCAPASSHAHLQGCISAQLHARALFRVGSPSCVERVLGWVLMGHLSRSLLKMTQLWPRSRLGGFTRGRICILAPRGTADPGGVFARGLHAPSGVKLLVGHGLNFGAPIGT